MKPYRDYKFFHPYSVMITLMILLLGNFSIGVSTAQQDSTPHSNNTANEMSNGVCVNAMRPFLSEKLSEYIIFMDKNFANKSNTSSLLDIAMRKYDEFQKEVMDKYHEYQPTDANSITYEGPEAGDCYDLVQTSLDTARYFIDTKAKMTSAVKKTTALMDKYKDINNKLAILEKSVLNFKVNMDSFATKVPCYIQKSCNVK